MVCTPPTFADGQLTADGKKFFSPDSEVAVTCNNNFVPVSLTTTCQSDRTWFPSPQCTRVSCVVPYLQNGYYKFNNVHVTADTRLAFQSVITPNCFDGYTPIPSTPRTCQSTSQWDVREQICKAITCVAFPKDFQNGYYDAEGRNSPYQYNQSITPSCKGGFHLQQGGERRCTGINEWSGEDAVCQRITCRHPNNFTHGNYNGTETVYPYITTLISSCQTGYRLNNKDNVRVCVNNNTWSGTEPECQIVQCSALPTIEHGTLSSDIPLYDYGTVLSVTCNHGYEANGRISVTCQADGTWDSPLLQCVPIRCNDSSGVKHKAVTDYPSLSFGEVGNVSYNTLLYSLTNGTLRVNCSSERKLNWITEPEFGKN